MGKYSVNMLKTFPDESEKNEMLGMSRNEQAYHFYSRGMPDQEHLMCL